MNLYQAFLQSVEKHAEPPALLWNEDRMSYSELANQVQACINWICEQPVTDPPHVGLLAPNTPYYAIAFFALLALESPDAAPGSGHISETRPAAVDAV